MIETDCFGNYKIVCEKRKMSVIDCYDLTIILYTHSKEKQPSTTAIKGISFSDNRF